MRIESLSPMLKSRLATIGEDAALHEAAMSLSNPGIGLVVVCDRSGTATGVVSKSDLVRHLAYPAVTTSSTASLMSRAVVSCKPHDDLRAVWQSMHAQELQNMPVLDALHRPVGVLDVRDALRTLLEAEELQEHLLADYVAGIGYR